jgi:phosphatidate cytidylyltransferase
MCHVAPLHHPVPMPRPPRAQGFIGAFFSTIVFGVLFAVFLAQYGYFICPVESLSGEIPPCTPDAVFLWQTWAIPEYLALPLAALGVTTTEVCACLCVSVRACYMCAECIASMCVRACTCTLHLTSVLACMQIAILPVALHAFVLSIFSSLVAPFGGFFASGVKRAFKIKVRVCVCVCV